VAGTDSRALASRESRIAPARHPQPARLEVEDIGRSDV
jgi:hypothetical protein